MYWPEDFGKRLADLRIKAGVSARDMSLSLGQGSGYINNIENGHNLPSMTVFFCICDYLKVSPSEFFDTNTSDPVKLKSILPKLQSMSSENLAALEAIINAMKK